MLPTNRRRPATTAPGTWLVVRAQQAGAVALLGSATPSLQSYSQRGGSGKIHSADAAPAHRGRGPCPAIRTVDLRQCGTCAVRAASSAPN